MIAKCRLPVVYIAGPYRGETEHETHENIRAAEEAAVALWRLGLVVLCPHKNSAGLGGAVPDEDFLAGCLELLRRCDAIYLLPRWKESRGARAEEQAARELGLVMLDSTAQAAHWRETPFKPSVARRGGAYATQCPGVDP